MSPPDLPDADEPLRFEPWFENSEGTVLRAEVPAREALDHWHRLRRKGGCYPVIVDHEEVARLTGMVPEHWDGDVAAIVAEADAMDAGTVLAERLASRSDDVEEAKSGWTFYTPFSSVHVTTASDDLAADFDARLLTPPSGPAEERSFVEDLAKTVSVAILPTGDGTLAPAHLIWGGWNDCPHAAEHVALLRYWHRLHGAELVTLTGDCLELRPRTPITDSEAAKRLAREWFAYSEDNAAQDHGSVQALAQHLLGARLWFSWWD